MADLRIRQNARNANVLKEDLRISNKPINENPLLKNGLKISSAY